MRTTVISRTYIVSWRYNDKTYDKEFPSVKDAYQYMILLENNGHNPTLHVKD